MTKHNNHFSDLHPAALLLYFIFIVIVIFMCDYSAPLIYAFISFSLCIVYIEGIKAYAKNLIFYAAVIAVTGAFNCMFNHFGEHVFLYVNDIPLTLDSLFYGMYTGIMISCLFMWFKLFNHSIDNGKINYLIGKHFPVCSLIISMCFSFTRRFAQKLDSIRQTLYVLNGNGSGISYHIKNAAVTLNTLMNVMLYDSVLTAESMTARGYGSKHRRIYKRYRIRLEDIIFIIAAALIFVMVFFCRLFIVPLILAPVFYNIYMELLCQFYQSKI